MATSLADDGYASKIIAGGLSSGMTVLVYVRLMRLCSVVVGLDDQG